MRTNSLNSTGCLRRSSQSTKRRALQLLAQTALSCLIAFGIVSGLQAAEVTTDKLDYAPGETALITGTGFAPREAVECQVVHSDGLDTGNGHDPWSVRTDANGDFSATWYVDPDDSAWATFILTAIGKKSGLVASTVFTDAPSKADLDQGRNGTIDVPISPVEWVNGNLNENQSHYVEGFSIPYRLVMTDLPIGEEVTLTLAYDAKHSGAHAIDWLTHYECLDVPEHSGLFGHVPETVDPVAGVAGVDPLTSTLTVPVPPFLNAPADTPANPVDAFNNSTTPECPKEITLFGGTLTPGSFVYGDPADLSESNVEQQFTVSFTATSSTAVLAWGGHIARQFDWGAELDGTPRSAGGISGSPYHMRTIDWSINNLGNQDRSLSAAAVAAPVECLLPEDFASCPGTVNTHVVSAENSTAYSWSFASNTSGASFVGPTDGISVDVLSGNSNGSYTLEVVVSGAGGDTICTQTVTVSDLEAPMVDCPSDLTLNCDDPVPAAATPTVTDNCDPDPSIDFSETSTGTCPTVITRTWTATDDVGNQTVCTQTITINDTIAPLLDCPADVTIECDESSAPGNTGTATAFDPCDSNPTVTFSDSTSGSCPTVITRTWTATDSCGNSSSCDQIITVDDTTAPVLNCPADTTVECDQSSDPASTGTATATDNCDDNLTVTFSDSASGSCPTIITRTWSATDSCGNTGSCDQIITVADSTAPVINCPPNISVECDESSDPASTGAATATDNCDSNPSVAFSDSVSGTCPTIITRTWTATDSCGNVGSCDQIITVVDSTAPVIAGCPSDVTVDCISQVPELEQLVATDNCDDDPVVTMTQTPSDISGVDPCGGTITRVWTAVDDCGNSASCTQVITVFDSTPPSITRFGIEHEVFTALSGNPRNPQDGDVIRLYLLSLCGDDEFFWQDPEASDACADPSIDWIDSGPLELPTSNGFAKLYTRIITVQDTCNQAEITVEVVLGECPTTFCTLTQGGWSVPDNFATKTAPAKTNGISRDIIVMKMFSDPACGGPRSLWIGKDTGNYVEVKSGEWKKLRLLLPSGGRAAPLPDPTMVDGVIAEASELSPILKKNGNFNNVLIGQAVALQLNVWLGDCPEAASDAEHPVMNIDNLGSLVMTPKFCTLPVDRIVMLEKQKASDPESVTGSMAELDVYHGTVPQGVFDALDALGMGHTVNDLVELTRLFLAGEEAGGVSATELVTANSSYNEGFSGCRILLDSAFCDPELTP